MKLWVVIFYLSTGNIGGSIGPLPYDFEECEKRIEVFNEGFTKENKPIRFVCEYHEDRPHNTKE
jgi:hypothetical protein